MADVLAGVRTRLLAVTGVTTLVSTRVYSGKLPQSPTFPAVLLQVIGDIETMHLRGGTNLHRARVQVDSISHEGSGGSRAQAVSLDAAVQGSYSAGAVTGLRGFKGTAGGVEIDAVIPAGVREGYDAEELRQYRVQRDYFVWFKG